MKNKNPLPFFCHSQKSISPDSSIFSKSTKNQRAGTMKFFTPQTTPLPAPFPTKSSSPNMECRKKSTQVLKISLVKSTFVSLAKEFTNIHFHTTHQKILPGRQFPSFLQQNHPQKQTTRKKKYFNTESG